MKVSCQHPLSLDGNKGKRAVNENGNEREKRRQKRVEVAPAQSRRSLYLFGQCHSITAKNSKHLQHLFCSRKYKHIESGTNNGGVSVYNFLTRFDHPKNKN